MRIEVYSECRADEGLLSDLKEAIDKDNILELVTDKPDLVVVLGDRPAALKRATEAAENHLPVAHISGGETTEGVIDNYVRDAITKMSHLHFTAADKYRIKVIKLGEHPDRVFWVGEPGLDKIMQTKDMKPKFRGYLVTYHPTLDDTNIGDLFMALKTIPESDEIIFTSPNTDKGYEKIIKEIKAFVKEKKNSKYIETMGRKSYLEHMKYAKAVVGNSSSGIVEAASFGTPCINIGDRQKGRLQGNNVKNVALDVMAIEEVLKYTYRLEVPQNPYYKDGKAIASIIRIIKQTDLKSILKKEFYE